MLRNIESMERIMRGLGWLVIIQDKTEIHDAFLLAFKVLNFLKLEVKQS